jgi:membrane protease YdiL (CAAX protease family)
MYTIEPVLPLSLMAFCVFSTQGYFRRYWDINRLREGTFIHYPRTNDQARPARQLRTDGDARPHPARRTDSHNLKKPEAITQAPSILRRSLQTITDLCIWLVALALGIFIEAFVMLRVLRLPIREIRLGADPRIWLAQFCQPLITLPVLTVALRWRGQRWSDLGLHKPANWLRFLKHVVFGFATMLVAAYAIRHLIIAPLHLRSHGFPALQGNQAGFIALTICALAGVGLNEELQFRGFLQNSFTRAFDGGTTGRYAAVIVTGLIFGLAHLSWGAGGMVYAGLLGILLGGIYLWAGGNLWVPVILHSLFDVNRAVQFFLYGNDLP